MTTSKKYAATCLFSLACWTSCLCQFAGAQTNFWFGSPVGNWSEAANWSIGTPDADDSVIIGSGNDVTLDVEAEVTSLEVAAGSSLTAEPGASISLSGAITGPPSSNAGDIVLSRDESAPFAVSRFTDIIFENMGDFDINQGALDLLGTTEFRHSAGVLDIESIIGGPALLMHDSSTLSISAGVTHLSRAPGGSAVRMFGTNTINFTGGTINMDAVVIIGDDGEFIHNGGTLSLLNTTSYFDGGTFAYRGGTINGTAKLTHTNLQLEVDDPVSIEIIQFPTSGPSTLSLSSNPFSMKRGLAMGQSIAIQPGAELQIDINRPTFQHYQGTITLGGSLIVPAGHRLRQGGGTINVAGGTIRGEHVYEGGAITSAGAGAATLRVEEGSLEIRAPLTLEAGDSIAISGGELILRDEPLVAPAGISLADAGLLRGNGDIGQVATPTNLTNSGRVTPGNSPGIISITGDYTQTADGSLEIEVASYNDPPGWVAGTDHDQLAVSGTAALGGRLDIEAINGFAPQPSDPDDPNDTPGPFEFITAGSVTGEFDAIVATGLPANIVADVQYTGTTATIEFVAPKLNIDFVDNSGNAADWFDGITTWDDTNSAGVEDVEPTEIHDVTVDNTTAALQQVNIETENALVARLTVGGAAGELNINVGDGVAGGSGNLSSQLGVEIVGNGSITLNADRLDTSSVMVDGGMLAGEGTIDLSGSTSNGTLTVASGTVSPGGNSAGLVVGTLNLIGEYFMQPDAQLAADIRAAQAGEADLLAVQGEVELNGTLQINVDELESGEIFAGNQFELIIAETGTGQFSDLVLIDTANLLDGYFLQPYYQNSGAGSNSDSGSGGVEESTFGAGATIRVAGDVTEDGMVTEEDVQFFTATLFAPPESIVDITFGNNTLESSAAFSHFDSTDDGIIDFDDIPGLVEQMQRFGDMSSAAARASIRLSIQRAIDRANVPEPTTVVMSLISLLAACWQRPRRS